MPQRYVRLINFLHSDSYRQKLFLNVFDSFYSYTIINVSWDRKFKIFPITFHVSSIPNFSESSLCVFFIKEVSIHKYIIITIFIKIFRMNPNGKINMVIFVILSLWFISSDDDWVTFLNIFLYPLKIIFVLWLRLLAVP